MTSRSRVALCILLLLGIVALEGPSSTRAADGDRYFPETGFWVPADFAEFWETHGGLMTLGYPISRVFYQDSLYTQYFERARFEYHPEHAGTQFEILLGLLGNDYAKEMKIPTSPVPQPADAVALQNQPGLASAVNPARPYRSYGAITMRETTARSHYHGLLTAFRYEGGRNGTLTVNYTLSRNRTDATNDRDAIDIPQNPLNPDADYADARTDRRHILTGSYIYELPFFRGDDANAFLKGAFGGWQVAGIVNINSGQPMPRISVLTNNFRRGGFADLFDGHVAMERGNGGELLQVVAEARDAAGGEGADGPGADGVDADVLGAEIPGEVARGGFQGGLGDAHDVVPGGHFLGTEAGERQDAAAVGHELLGAVGKRDERIDRDVVREQEALARGIDEAAHEVVAVGEGDGMDQDVDGAEALLSLREDGVELGIVGDVAELDEIGADAFGEGPDTLFERWHGIGEGEFGAFPVKRLGNPPGDGMVVCDAEDERRLAL